MNEMQRELWQGLSTWPKVIDDKYYYLYGGSEYFERLMDHDHYYLTRAEYEIFETHRETIIDSIAQGGTPINLIEFGVGNGFKTKVLLEGLEAHRVPLTFFPVDFDDDVLERLVCDLRSAHPGLDVQPRCGDFVDTLSTLPTSHPRNVIFFLGSSFGAFTPEAGRQFLESVHRTLSPGDTLLLGFDLKKDPRVLFDAYEETCREWCSYLLDIVNRITGGTFEKERFEYYVNYDPTSGYFSWYLLSKEDQVVDLRHCGKSVRFDRWEPIRVGRSRKLSPTEIAELAEATGFVSERLFMDPQERFANVVWRRP